MGDELHFFTYHHTPGIFVYSGNFGYDFATFFYINHIADMQVEPFNDIRIMQRGAFYDCTR